MYTKKQISDVYKNLPQKMREIMASIELGYVINNILKTYSLTKKQSDEVGQLITYILLGIENKNELTKKIQEKLLVDHSTASKITKDVEDKILNNLDGLYQLIQKNIEAEDRARGIFDEDIVTEKPEKILVNKVSDNKIQDIANKYSLDTARTEILNKIISTSTTLEIENNLRKEIVDKIGVSELLAEQIVGDLKNKAVKNLNTTKVQPEKTISRVLELAPKNLPMVEVGEVAHNNPKPEVSIATQVQNIPKYTPPTPSVPRVSPEPPIQLKPKPTQVYQPITQMPPAPVIKPVSLPQTPREPTTPKQMPVQEKPPQKYIVDPYREPLE